MKFLDNYSINSSKINNFIYAHQKLVQIKIVFYFQNIYYSFNRFIVACKIVNDIHSRNFLKLSFDRKLLSYNNIVIDNLYIVMLMDDLSLPYTQYKLSTLDERGFFNFSMFLMTISWREQYRFLTSLNTSHKLRNSFSSNS